MKRLLVAWLATLVLDASAGDPSCGTWLGELAMPKFPDAPVEGASGWWTNLADAFFARRHALRGTRLAQAQEEHAKRIDLAFERMIQTYSLETRGLLERMYRDRRGVTFVDGLLEGSGLYANWRYSPQRGWEVVVDRSLERMPLILRVTLVHEIAVHIGQGNEVLRDYGLVEGVARLRSLDFSRWTEVAAALAEKRLLDGIPKEVLVGELWSENRHPDRARHFWDFLRRRNTTEADYVRLMHRPDRPVLGADEVERMADRLRNAIPR